MTFGYNAYVRVNNTVDGLDTPVSVLIHSLKVEREVRRPSPVGVHLTDIAWR